MERHYHRRRRRRRRRRAAGAARTRKHVERPQSADLLAGCFLRVVLGHTGTSAHVRGKVYGELTRKGALSSSEIFSCTKIWQTGQREATR